MEDVKKDIGRYSENELIEKIKSGEIEYVTLYVPGANQVFSKRFEGKYFMNYILPKQMNFPELASLFTIENTPIFPPELQSHFRDTLVKVDKSTIRNMAWLGKGYALCMGIMENEEGELFDYYPRNILYKLLQRVEKEQGIRFAAASELEFYVFKTRSPDITQDYPSIDLNKHKTTTRGSDYCTSQIMDRNESFTKKLKENVRDSGIILEGLFSEHGPGQHEINILYGDVINNCDSHTLLKQCLKKTAYDEGLGLSFMAKPFIDRDGCSSHIHISLSKDGRNFFAPSNSETDYSVKVNDKKTIKVSINMMYFIGGLIKYVRELMLIYAPNVNSYKRYKKNSFAPVYINTWCYDSRYSTVRMIGKEDSLRIEFRASGSDCNPYLLISALIASGMKGIEEKIMPHAMDVDNDYETVKTDYQKAPMNLYEAIGYFEKSELAEEMFGKGFKNFLIMTANQEWDDFQNHISNWEVNRYLDLV
jgi:glutamine synthetase